VQRIVHHVRSKTLRIAWVEHATTPKAFIVFDAVSGPCVVAGGDPVLNGVCNEFYEPGENPYNTLSSPTCLNPKKRPWLSTSRNAPFL
jgi:hypothetical protein